MVHHAATPAKMEERKEAAAAPRGKVEEAFGPLEFKVEVFLAFFFT